MHICQAGGGESHGGAVTASAAGVINNMAVYRDAQVIDYAGLGHDEQGRYEIGYNYSLS